MTIEDETMYASLKRANGERLTQRELWILAYLVDAGGCHACGATQRSSIDLEKVN